MFAWQISDPSETGAWVTDLYRWDGAFVKRLYGPLPTSVDGRYVLDSSVNHILTTDGKVVGTLPMGAIGFQWADDGPYLCRYDSASPHFWVTDVHGKVIRDLTNAGYGWDLSRCDVLSNLAVIVHAPVLDVMSLSDGHVIRSVDISQMSAPGLSGGYFLQIAVSPDARWLAGLTLGNAGLTEIDVVDLDTGAVTARLPYGVLLQNTRNLAFMPDGAGLVVNDDVGPTVRLIDWRHDKELASLPGELSTVIESDRSTNRMLVTVWNLESGANTVATWILDKRGGAVPFRPRPYGVNGQL